MGPRRATALRLTRGSIVLVPFPFTDLSGSKQRPALVVSPEGFHREDLILCAITSQAPDTPGRWDVKLAASDLHEASLPKLSLILVGKLFTMHQALIVGGFGRVTSAKLAEVQARLVRLLGPSGSESWRPEL